VRIVAVLMLVARVASADDGHAFASVGGTFGATYDAHGARPMFGGEFSCGWFDTNSPWPSTSQHSFDSSPPIDFDLPDVHKWIGGYFDAIYDDEIHQTRVSFGPEVGIERFGTDTGFVIEPDTRRTGWSLRVGTHLGPAWVFVRGVQLFDSRPDSTRLDVGLQLKLPWAFQ
jgi:hypothetical protein